MLASALAIGSCLLGEAALRIAGFEQPAPAERDVVWSRARDPELFERRLYQRDACEIWKPVPGAELPGGERLDPHGFRGPELPLARKPGSVRIAVLGADEAFGAGLEREQTWPQLLKRALAEQGAEVEVLCAAVEGSTLRQGIERWRAEVQPFQPDLVLCTYAGEYESRAANCGCTDSERIQSNCGQGFPDLRERPAGSAAPLRAARLAQCTAWVVDVLDGDYWAVRARELDAQRLALSEDRFEAAGTRRVPAEEFVALAAQLHEELEREKVKLLLVPITGEKALRNQSTAVRGYQALLLESAKRNNIPRFALLELFEQALLGGAHVEDFYAGGRLSDGGQRFVARELEGVLAHRLRELQHR